MSRRKPPTPPRRPSPPHPGDRTVVLSELSEDALGPVLHQLPAANGARLLPGATGASVEAHLNAVLGCKTTEMALGVLAQVVDIEDPNRAQIMGSQEQVDRIMSKAIASLAELEPATATEALLAAQMVGAQRMAMTFMRRALFDGQTQEGVDVNVARATRVMRVFNEQIEAMAKLKGKSGQQRVTVEHVTVNDGGQAIVGAVAATKAILPGGRGG